MEFVSRALEAVADWREPAPDHPALVPDPARFESAWAEFTERMALNHPFHHPRYAGQMLKPPHPVAIAAYTAAMHVNPNNHALDGGPATSYMELEVMQWLTEMFGLPGDALGHLTSSGTIANLEALWVARELHPGKAVIHGTNAHYTHGRMCAVLGIEAFAVPADAAGRIDLDIVEKLCATGDIGTVVVTAGTTGVGAVDDIARAAALRERFGVRVHVDAAYGGFFTLLAREGLVTDAFLAIADCDSVVVDPHKHGLQPYGCGAVLFRDPDVGRLYKHDSPYTYFTSGDLHLGEISLECSRAGAAAAALWLTLRALDLGPILAAGLRAARAWAELIEASDELTLHLAPELDIVTYFPTRPRASEIDAASERVLQAGMTDPDPVYLSTLKIDAPAFAAVHPEVEMDAGDVRILRSVLMKPEHEPYVPWLHRRVTEISRR
ncbi:MAG TPA: pyridoxal-dependent decarboxylase [Solirubrobacter sp.]|nr:pyridoxal-dependent decarboxylase [Solirubrobacter sp.]